MPEIGSRSADSPDTSPAFLRPYRFHGLDLDPPRAGEEAMTDCPFCGKDGKFSVNISTGKWRCWACELRGNISTFMKTLWEHSFQHSDTDYSALREDRKLLSDEGLKEWGVALSITSDEWVLPGYNAKKAFSQLYKYTLDRRSGKHRLYSTPETNQHLMGMHLFDPSRPYIYITEGPWDGIALWETMRMSRVDPTDPSNLLPTDDPEQSLLTQANVLSVPGCNSFFEAWLPIFEGKHVVFLYDNDHPREYNGRVVEPAGFAFTRRACSILAGADNPPASLHYLCWGDGGYDSNLPSGYDLRDKLSEDDSPDGRVMILADLLRMVRPIPEDWLAGRSLEARKSGGTDLELLPCRSWDEVTNQFRKAMHWTAGMEYALAVMLATVTSTKMKGDQLWVKVISPASTGKTALVESLAVNRKHTKLVGNFTGLHSGFQTDKDGEEDHSLISLLKDKTLIVKEGDTLLKAPNRERIFAQIRDAYDTYCSTAYGNRVKREYHLRFSFILCGTPSLFEVDSSELGDRFLVCNIMEGIDLELETDINRRMFYRVLRGRGEEADGVPASYDEPNMLKAKQLVGGYVNYLRENSAQLLDSLDDSDADILVDRFDQLAKFIAYMRARPSRKQDEMTGREMSARINSQLTRLALCLAVVLNKDKLTDPAVVRYTTRVAIDSSRGRIFNMVKELYTKGEEGASAGALSGYLNRTETKVMDDVTFLKSLGVIEAYRSATGHHQIKYRLTQMMRHLFENVMSVPVMTKPTQPSEE